MGWRMPRCTDVFRSQSNAKVVWGAFFGTSWFPPYICERPLSTRFRPRGHEFPTIATVFNFLSKRGLTGWSKSMHTYRDPASLHKYRLRASGEMVPCVHGAGYCTSKLAYSSPLLHGCFEREEKNNILHPAQLMQFRALQRIRIPVNLRDDVCYYAPVSLALVAGYRRSRKQGHVRRCMGG